MLLEVWRWQQELASPRIGWTKSASGWGALVVVSRRLEQDLVDAICGSSVTPRSTDTLPGAGTANTTSDAPSLVSHPDNEDRVISTQTVYRPREVRHLLLGLLAGLGLQFGISFLLTCILQVLNLVGIIELRLSASSSCDALF